MKSTEQILKQQIASGQTPAISYAFFDARCIRYDFAGGMSDLLLGKAFDSHTMVNGFSVTKTFTALAILQLEEGGKLNLDDRVTTYLPRFPYGPAVTIRHLLHHTAGIPNPVPLQWIHLSGEHTAFDRHRYFEPVFAKYARARSAAGAKFAYSNLGYIILGDIIERVSGESYEDYMTNHVLSKIAGPDHLSFTIRTALHAKGYQKRHSVMNLLLGLFIDKRKYMGPAEGCWKPFRPIYMNGAPYGGLLCSTEGLVQYGQALLQPGRLLSEESKARLFTENRTPEGKATGMCLSWFTDTLIGQRFFTHAGGGGGFYVELRLYPDLGYGSVVMLNRSGMKDERLLDKLDAPFIHAVIR